MTETALKLFGTTRVEPPSRELQAGALTATLDGVNLRWIRWRGVEIVRGLFFLVRNAGWGTPSISIQSLDVESTAADFIVSYRGIVQDGDARLAISVRITGFAVGDIFARADVLPETDFVTNRTGFVVLHPIEGVAGSTIEVDHGEESVEAVTIPELISPAQPVRAIHGLRFGPKDGVSVDFRFEGDVFEMEDQRNWTDASFKTYSRPLDWPRPFTLAAGSPIAQTVSMTVREVASPKRRTPAPNEAIRVRLGKPTDVVLPRIGLALPLELAADALAQGARLRSLGLDHLVVRLDPSDPRQGSLGDVSRLSALTDLPVTLDILLTAESDPRQDIASVAAAAKTAGLRVREVAAFPKLDERSFQPDEVRPLTPTFADIGAALKAAFPSAMITGGTPAFFTELNRKRPAAEGLDVIAYGTCAIVHAADDKSVMETLQSLPWIIRSTRAFGGERPIRLGPIGIGARLNPYGTGPEQNPANDRVGLAGVDPRQRGLFGAAWHVGYAASIAPHGVRSLIVGAPTGAFGLAYSQQPYPQPWFDDHARPAVFPLFHVVADLARAGGKRWVETQVSDGTRVAGLAWDDGDDVVLVLANLTGETRPVLIVDRPGAGWLRVLDEASFVEAVLNPSRFAESRDTFDADVLHLRPYAVVTLTWPGGGHEDPWTAPATAAT